MKLHSYTYRFLMASFALCAVFALVSLLYVSRAPTGAAFVALATGNAMVYEAMKGLLFALIGAAALEFFFHAVDRKNS